MTINGARRGTFFSSAPTFIQPTRRHNMFNKSILAAAFTVTTPAGFVADSEVK
jgi:hypothetical protein